MDFSPRENSASFVGVAKNGQKEDFGAAFINLPDYVIPAIAVVHKVKGSTQEVDVKISYIAGPIGMYSYLVQLSQSF